MKTYLLILCFIISSINCFSQEMSFEVGFSKNYATLDFLNNLSPNSPTNPYKEVFENSKYNIEKYQQLSVDFGEINISYWYEYPQYPYGNKIGGSTYFILCRNLIESENLQEFKRKSFGIIPNQDLNKLYEILVEFQPIYNQLIFKPSELKFNKQIEKTRQVISKVDIDALFKQTINFYRTNWDLSIPIKLYISPIPDAREKGFTATAFYNLAIAGIPQGFKNFYELLTVMFHESFHILYDEQSLKVKKDVAIWFENNNYKSSNYAQLLFNEAITTSIANGYLYQKLTGELPVGNWYNNKFISNMAQKMYPLVEEYFNENKVIDQDFVNTYISILDKEFPSWLQDIDFILMQRYVISESPNAYNELLKEHGYSNIDEYESKLNLLTIEKMKTHPVTKVIVITNENQKDLDLVKDSFEELKEWSPDGNSEFVYSKFLKDRTYLIVINTNSDNITRLIKNITLE